VFFLHDEVAMLDATPILSFLLVVCTSALMLCNPALQIIKAPIGESNIRCSSNYFELEQRPLSPFAVPYRLADV